MNNKPPPSEDSSKADLEVNPAPSTDENAAKKALRPAREGNENLRQRAEWFRSRTAGDK